MKLALYIYNSKDRKIGKGVDATYASISKTCPNTCAQKNSGCYASLGPTGIHVNRLDSGLEETTYNTLDLAKAEAELISNAYKDKKPTGKKLLRIHVSGDSRTIKGSKLINSAVGEWKNNGGHIAWTYTHAWKNVPRKVWNNVSVLASVDKIEDIDNARKQGYAPAIIVSKFDGKKLFSIEGTDTKFIPCPYETHGVTCDKCKLCMKADFLFKNNKGIAFKAHGAQKKKLKVIQ